MYQGAIFFKSKIIEVDLLIWSQAPGQCWLNIIEFPLCGSCTSSWIVILMWCRFSIKPLLSPVIRSQPNLSYTILPAEPQMFLYNKTPNNETRREETGPFEDKIPLPMMTPLNRPQPLSSHPSGILRRDRQRGFSQTRTSWGDSLPFHSAPASINIRRVHRKRGSVCTVPPPWSSNSLDFFSLNFQECNLAFMC